MSNYKAMAARIRSESDFAKLERSLARLYNAGCLTVNEFMRLDVLLMEVQCAEDK